MNYFHPQLLDAKGLEKVETGRKESFRVPVIS
jgi:hypothetical protein